MFVVAIVGLAGPIEQEALALASDLGATAYDARLLLAPGLPAIVLMTPVRSAAVELLSKLKGRGVDALAFDSAAVVSSRLMFSPRIFHLETDAMVVEAPEPQRLSFPDVIAMLRATHETRIESTSQQKERKFSAGRALLSGGLVMTKTQEKTVSSRSEARQEVLYVYRAAGQAPWILRESGMRYDSLGEKKASSEHANFAVVVEALRAGAPKAICDDRLVRRKIPDRIAQVAVVGGSAASRTEVASDAGMDLMAHVTAMWLLRSASAAR
jgi:hypothetical protein